MVAGVRTGEDTEDLREFLSHLDGGPEVTETFLLHCDNHGDQRPTWTYVEADSRTGVARRRCLQCAQSTWMLDSEGRWSFPKVWSCGSCGQSICEVAAGVAMPDDTHVSWLVLGARCVDCGRVDGLTDLVLPGYPLTDVMNGL